MLHNRYKIMGGEDVSTDAECSLLKSHGIDVDTVFITNDIITNKNKFKVALNTVWSSKYYHEILKKIQEGKYDIVHVQNFFPLFSPSIFYAAQKAGAKIVMSVRNYRLICPNGLMYIKNSICNECVGKTIPYPAISKKCYRDSYGATCVTVAMLSVHNFLNTWKKEIDGFICISDFVKEQLVLGNFDKTKLHVKYNFVSSNVPVNFEAGDYYIYVGRLSIEKGIDVLLDSFKANSRKLLIIGDGPLKQDVINASAENNNISFLGKLSLNETYSKIAGAKALIFPSKWHEPFGRTIVESFAHGTPVIGSSLGGVPELIKDGFNGFLFDPHNESDLNTTINKFEGIEDGQTLRNNAYASFMDNFTPSKNFDSIIAIYNKILSVK